MVVFYVKRYYVLSMCRVDAGPPTERVKGNKCNEHETIYKKQLAFF